MEYQQDQETLKKIRDVIGHLDMPPAILPQDFHAFKEEVNDRLERIEGMLYQISNTLKETRAEQRGKGRRLQFQSTVMECSSPQMVSPLATPQRDISIYSFCDSPGSNIVQPLCKVNASPKVVPKYKSPRSNFHQELNSEVTPSTDVVKSYISFEQNEKDRREPVASTPQNSLNLTGTNVSVDDIINIMNQNQLQVINVPAVNHVHNETIYDKDFWLLTLNQIEGVGLTSARIKALLKDGPASIPTEAEFAQTTELCKTKALGSGGAKDFAKSLFSIMFRLGEVYEKNTSGKGPKNRTALDKKKMKLIEGAVTSQYGPQTWPESLSAINKHITYLFGKTRLGKPEVRQWLQVFPEGQFVPGFE